MLYRFKNSTTILRAKKQDERAVSCALIELTQKPEWKKLASQEQQMEALLAEREGVLADRRARGASGWMMKIPSFFDSDRVYIFANDGILL